MVVSYLWILRTEPKTTGIAGLLLLTAKPSLQSFSIFCVGSGRPNLRSSYLHSKNFTYGPISPARRNLIVMA